MKRLIAAAALGGLIATAAPAFAKEGDVIVRLRGIVVAPTGGSDSVQPGFPTGSADVGAAFMPEIDGTYMVSDNIGLELIASTTRHEAKGRGALNGVEKLASTWALPPTLTLQYHLAPEAKVRPYVGVGVNYTIFYDSKAGKDLVAAVGPTKVKLGDSFGYAVQAGVDIDLNEKMFLNLDVKYIDMDTKARLTTGGAVNTTRFHLDPIVAGVGIGMRF
ncbi:OmpW family outer membrane protein [Sphingomonas sp.]|uniref:OmpW/AlkL family protein n=1 Tax=Sphingomonas sp. TaxID=28214 RepID=UPI001ECA9C28|nr:OmpW family outer membrane protein [Sphingomonas sp.]MBX3593362.1 OmpW family protein [Sphingomonas sp.]